MSQQLVLPCRVRPSPYASGCLPPELLELVFDHLDRASIVAALKTCKRWNDVAVSMILRVDRCQGRLLAKKAANNTFLGSRLRHLSIDYSFDNKSFWCVDADAADILSATPNLRSLSIHGYWEITEDEPWQGGDGETDPPWTDWPAEEARLVSLLEMSEHLPKLESCTFHYRDTGETQIHWGLENHVGVFLNANIKVLKIIDAYHMGPDELIYQYDNRYYASTALQSLRFDRCDLDIASFRKILCFPKALRQLTYTDRQCWDKNWDVPEIKNATAFAEALMPQRESLETVHLQGLYHGELGARFGDMKRLKHLDIELAILFGCGKVPRDNAECYALNEIPINELLPPTLESLTLRYNMLATLAKEQLHTSALHRLLSGMQRFLPSFQKLALLREHKESLTRGCRGISKHARGCREISKRDEKVNGLFTSIEGVCRSLNIELVDGGFYEEFANWFQCSHKSPP